MGAALGGGGKRAKKHRQFNDINVTPFVDVMLVLLIIFMVTAPMLTTGVNVDLPETSAAALPGQDEPLSVSIRNNGEVYIQESKVTVDKLGAKLRAITGEKRDTRIFVRGDARVDYGRIMLVVGEINAAGYTKVALVTAQAAPKAQER